MPFIDDMQERDLALLQTLDGRDITYMPQTGVPTTISGMLQELSELLPGESVEVVVSAPVLSVRAVDVPDIAVDDRFEIDGNSYTAVVIQPDNEGMVSIKLERE